MKLLNNRISAVFFMVPTALLYIILSLSVKIPLDNINDNVWSGYYILALEENAPVEAIISKLHQEGGWTILSEFNEKVEVFTHKGKEYVYVNDLKDYYVAGDPLFDPYLRKLSSLFKGWIESHLYHLVYIQSDQNSAAIYKDINKIIGDSSYKWLLPEINSENRLVSLIIFALTLFLLYFWHKELWPLLVSGIYPWFQFTSGIGYPGMLVSVIFLFSLILLGSQLYKPYRHYLNLGTFTPVNRKNIILSLIIMFLSFFYIIINFLSRFSLAAYFLAVLSHFFSITFFLIVLNYKRKMQQHRIFFPLKIKFNSLDIHKPDLFIFSVFILIIVISPLIIEGKSFESGIEIPSPAEIEGLSDFSQISLQILNKHSIDSELPDLSDYISHMMYLKTYPFGFAYTFPEPDQSFSVPFFLLDTEGVKEENLSIFMFTESWYESIMDIELNTGIIKLLLEQNYPGLIGYKSEYDNPVNEIYITNHYWFSVVLVLVLVFWLSNLSPSGWYVLKEILLRRKQQIV
jgi:hypothetical protein